jgi:hypothetical protein
MEPDNQDFEKNPFLPDPGGLNFPLPWINPERHIPSRKIPRSAAAITGRCWSEKMKRHVQHESLLEKNLFQVVESIPSIVSYLEQPFPIRYIGADGKPHIYTADLLVVPEPPSSQPWRVAPILLEVKPADKLFRWVQKHEDLVMAASAFAKKLGMQYRIVTDEEIVKRKGDLIQWLCSQPALLIQDRLHLPILRVVATYPGIPFQELMRRFELRGFSRVEFINTVYTLIREGYVRLESRDGKLPGSTLRLKVPAHYLSSPNRGMTSH